MRVVIMQLLTPWILRLLRQTQRQAQVAEKPGSATMPENLQQPLTQVIMLVLEVLHLWLMMMMFRQRSRPHQEIQLYLQA
mmetsp:Transcript_750/g.2069  ORF Transcript_750/g.2069 Transcript_750/m.2069 type:complete len:80 (-) Transcript_750:276-515(-)